MLKDARHRTVCLVTNEIYPFAPGGIGRLISNWIVQNKEIEGSDIHLLFPEELSARASEIAEYCTNYDVTIHFCEARCSSDTEFGAFLTHSGHRDWNYLQAYYAAYSYFSKLKELEGSGTIFDVIEFPDYGGWGAVSIEAKRSGIAFYDTQIAVRLHSTFGIIVKHEEFYHQTSGWHAGLVDLERFALEHADIVVGHIREIARQNMEFYRFPESWLERVVIEVPPIYIDDDVSYDEILDYRAGTRFVFSSRFQPFKRPDLFIKASCLYFDKGNDGESLLISYGWDESYIAWLKSLIPLELREKIRILTNLTSSERRQMLVGATIVVPSDYESYCLFAYESALQGNRILLRRSCSAFGQHEAWIDGENCLMFGDTPESLALAMEKSVAWLPTTKLITRHDIPYWNDVSRAPESPEASETPDVPLTLHLLICDVEDNQRLERCKQILKEQEFDAATILISSSLKNRKSALQLEFPNVNVVVSAYGRLQMDEVYDKLIKFEEDVVAICFASDLSNRYFCQVAKGIFAKNPSIGVVTSHDIIIDNQGVKSIQFTAGEQASCALAGMQVVGRLVGVRRDVVLQQGYEYASRTYGWQALFQALRTNGVEICVIPDVLSYTNFSNNAKNLNLYYPTQLNRNLSCAHSFASAYGLLLDRADFTDCYRKTVVRDVSAETPLVRVHPKNQEWWGNQVSFNADKKQWLIHPMEADVVIAQLHLNRDLGDADAFFVDINNNGQNSGVVISLIVAGPGQKSPNIVDWAEQADRYSQTTFVPSGETRRIVCSKQDLVFVSDLYIVSKVPPQQSSENCWAMLARYGGLYL